MAPLSHALRAGGGFESEYQEKPLTHIMFMDDLKVYEQSKKELEATVGTVESVSGAVGMTFSLRKCAVAHMRAGRVKRLGGISAGHAGNISEVMSGSYRYLGVEQLMGPKDSRTRKRVEDEYLHRVRKTWNSRLSVGSKVRAHNSWCVAVLRYFSSVVDWGETGMSKVDVCTRKVLRATKSHHKCSAIERLYLPRKMGGRGLQNLEQMKEREVVSAALYARGSSDVQVIGAMRLQRELEYMGENTLMTRAKAALRKYEIPTSSLEWNRTEEETCPRKSLLRRLTEKQTEKLEWRGKAIHGRFKRELERPGTDREATHRWLTLQPETEMIVIGAQDGVTHTNWYKKRYLGGKTDKCRICETKMETVGHILSNCPGHGWGLIKQRHNRVLCLLVKAVMDSMAWPMSKSMAVHGIATAGVWGTEEERVLIDQAIPTSRKITECRPDLVIRSKTRKKIVIFDVACALDHLVQKREAEKKAKYQELAADLATQWRGCGVTVTPVVLGDLGLVAGLARHLGRSGVLKDEAIAGFMGHAQREVLCAAIQILKRHMKA